MRTGPREPSARLRGNDGQATGAAVIIAPGGAHSFLAIDIEGYNVARSRVAIMGFSAGGEVAALASTRFEPANPGAADPVDKLSSRPDYQILIYPGIRAENFAVTADTPKTFLLCADKVAVTRHVHVPASPSYRPRR